MRFRSLVAAGAIAADPIALALAALVLLGLWPAASPKAREPPSPARSPGYVVAFGDSDRGRDLFTGKGCVVCHAINGVGGKAAPALDADPLEPELDVFEFAARMWRGAPTMIVLQEMELGYQIELTGRELADLARFINDAEAQRSFTENDVPELIRDWMVDEVYDELDIEGMAQ
ncbi:MAG TPA: c-type cytochrome [Kiloniellales bacterium]